MHKIDFSFISQLEGGQILEGYVPAATQSKSGVTIATGFDLGQRNTSDLKKMGLSGKLLDKLKPYLGLTSTKAKEKLKTSPLTITKSEATAIDKAAKSALVSSLIKKYNQAISKDKTSFSQLFSAAQTVIASVSFQYGNLSAKAPSFWRCVTQQNWDKAIKELRNFGDKYPTRRKKEADLLEKGWGDEKFYKDIFDYNPPVKRMKGTKTNQWDWKTSPPDNWLT